MMPKLMFIILNILDCVTTEIGLRVGLYEANSFMRSLFSIDHGLGYFIKMMLALTVVIVLTLWHKEHLFKILNIGFSIVVISNIIWILVAVLIL